MNNVVHTLERDDDESELSDVVGFDEDVDDDENNSEGILETRDGMDFFVCKSTNPV